MIFGFRTPDLGYGLLLKYIVKLVQPNFRVIRIPAVSNFEPYFLCEPPLLSDS